MSNPSTKMLSAATDGVTVTDRYAVCAVCGCQWQIQSEDDADAKGCSFCDAPATAISIVSEAPDYQGNIGR